MNYPFPGGHKQYPIDFELRPLIAEYLGIDEKRVTADFLCMMAQLRAAFPDDRLRATLVLITLGKMTGLEFILGGSS